MKKGFTLIELLAVIVILAIIALIATPIILGIINDVRVGARERSIDNIIHAAEMYYAKEYVKDPTRTNRINIEEIKDEIKGEVPVSGYVIINNDGESIFNIKYKDKTYVKLTTGEIVEELNDSDKYYLKYATQTNGETEPFLEGPKTKAQIEKVITVPTNKVPSDVIGYWDVTDTTNQSETGKVMAWYYDKDSNGLYEVYIGQEGRVKANPDSTRLFNFLINAKEIDLTYLDTSNVVNMEAMFQRCENLEMITGLENFDTSIVESMHRMFSVCTNLKEIDVSNFDTSNVENMKFMFAGFNVDNVEYYMQLERIIGLENFDTSQVTDMYGMFQRCSNLTTLDLRSFDTSQVTDMTNMFWGCSSLTELDVSDFDTSKVTNMKTMFSRCSSLTMLDLRKWDTSQVTDMSNMFNATINLKPIYIGEKWKTVDTSANLFSSNALTKSVDEMCGPNSTHSWCLVTQTN